MSNLEDYRTSIDLLDEAIINLLAERMRIVQKVGEYKKQNNLAPLQKERWKKVLSSKLNLAKSKNLDPLLVADIWNMIHKHALEMEKR